MQEGPRKVATAETCTVPYMNMTKGYDQVDVTGSFESLQQTTASAALSLSHTQVSTLQLLTCLKTNTSDNTQKQQHKEQAAGLYKPDRSKYNSGPTLASRSTGWFPLAKLATASVPAAATLATLPNSTSIPLPPFHL